MRTKRNISLIFLYLAMAVFLLHSLVPHYHCSDGQVSFFLHHHHCCCEVTSCQTHHCDEVHIFHNHHTENNDGDCVLNNPFLKVAEEDSKIQIPIFNLSLCVGTSCDFSKLIVENQSQTSVTYPDIIEQYQSVLLTASCGLRAPPMC